MGAEMDKVKNKWCPTSQLPWGRWSEIKYLGTDEKGQDSKERLEKDRFK